VSGVNGDFPMTARVGPLRMPYTQIKAATGYPIPARIVLVSHGTHPAGL
jgi:hypothetical protein